MTYDWAAPQPNLTLGPAGPTGMSARFLCGREGPLYTSYNGTRPGDRCLDCEHAAQLLLTMFSSRGDGGWYLCEHCAVVVALWAEDRFACHDLEFAREPIK